MTVWEGETYLVVVAGSAAEKYHRIRAGMTFGRDPNADIPVLSRAASRAHALIKRGSDGQLLLVDLGSRNGTLVNGKLTKERALELGDTIQIGGTVFVVADRSAIRDRDLETDHLRALRQVARRMSHRFNNLMSVVLSNVEFLRHETADERQGEKPVREEKDEVLAEIETAAHQVIEMTNRLLGFADEPGRKAEPCDIGSLISEVAMVLKSQLESKVELAVDVEPELIVDGDRSALHTMLMNLCVNSLDAMPSGGTLEITSREARPDEASSIPPDAPGAVVITVRDTGVGINEKLHKHVFDPLFTTKHQEENIGLGLTAVYGIVRGHHGHIAFESTPGQGCTFQVTLPRYDTDEPTMVVMPSQTPSSLEGAYVLVVDDERPIVDCTRRLLEQLGCEVTCALSGKEALESIKERVGTPEEIELVILDFLMPEMNGMETFKKLKEADPNLAIVLTSGYSERVLPKVEEIGEPVFLKKPFTLGTLVDALEKASVDVPNHRKV